MYTNAQVVIDLDEYNDLRKKVEAFERGNDNTEREFLLLCIQNMVNNSNTLDVLLGNIPKNMGYSLTGTGGKGEYKINVIKRD